MVKSSSRVATRCLKTSLKPGCSIAIFTSALHCEQGIGAPLLEVAMKHQTLDQMQTIADVHQDPTRLGMTRTQRLERWAELLEDKPHRILTALEGTEHRPLPERHAMRANCSPISVAFEDTVLRNEGLANDSYGEAKRFFELTDKQLHEIVCYCHVGASMQSSRAAQCVRWSVQGRGFLAGLRQTFGLHH
jgi:hypothetical protein